MNREITRSILGLKVKDAAAPLDIKRLTFPLMSAAMLRIIGFDWYERTELPEHYSGYGQEVSRYDNDGTMELIKRIDKNAVYVNHYTDFDTLKIDAPAR